MVDVVALMKKLATKKLRKILLIEGEDERILKGAVMAVEKNICEPVLLGNQKIILKLSAKLGLDPSGISIIEYKGHPKLDDYARELAEIRKKKKLSIEEAKKLLENPNYFGALLLRLGEVDGAVGGCKYSTADWMRPVFQVVGSKEGISIVSGICFMSFKDKTFFFADTDFIIKPNKEELAQIAINSNDFVKGLGIKPKVALLSHSTKGSGEHPSLEFIRDALRIVKKKRPDIVIDGEMQFDAAINPKAAKKKCPDSPIKGEANVLVFPDIAVGNVLIHALMEFTDSELYGSFPVGLSKPVINGGRNFSAKEIYDSILACAAEANMKND